jgi:hypothetical protein
MLHRLNPLGPSPPAPPANTSQPPDETRKDRVNAMTTPTIHINGAPKPIATTTQSEPEPIATHVARIYLDGLPYTVTTRTWWKDELEATPCRLCPVCHAHTTLSAEMACAVVAHGHARS